MTSLAPTRPPRDLIHWIASLNYRSIQLDAARAGIRPRQLDRSARRDLAALLSRLELSLAGVDLLIPPTHFQDSETVDRAMAATLEAIHFTAELATLAAAAPILTLELPQDAPQTIDPLTDAAAQQGVTLANIAHPPTAPEDTRSAITAAIDPAAILASGQAGVDPAQAVLTCPVPIASARLSDLASTGRVAPGAGRLDILAYTVALTTRNYAGPLITDLRNVPNQARAAEDVINTFNPTSQM